MASAVARPMPLEAPVIKATCPLNIIPSSELIDVAFQSFSKPTSLVIQNFTFAIPAAIQILHPTVAFEPFLSFSAS
jgi:hypothetical protein